MANGYWNAHSDLDWLEQCGVEDGPPCEMCESSTGNFCLVCGFEEGEKCPYETPAVTGIGAGEPFTDGRQRPRPDALTPDEDALVRYARAWDGVLKTLFGGDR